MYKSDPSYIVLLELAEKLRKFPPSKKATRNEFCVEELIQRERVTKINKRCWLGVVKVMKLLANYVVARS